MRVHRLILDNFRCFERLELELEDTTTLLIGANGSGKSAILDGMAIALGAWLSGTSQATREDRTIEREDARLVRQEGEGLATVNPVFPVRVAASGSAHSGLKWSLAPDGPDTGALLRDQHHLCAYCGGRLDPSTMKIEHFVPQSADRSLILDWSNLLGACPGRYRDPTTGKTITHCDSHRTKFAPGPPPRGLLSVHPAQTDPGHHFRVNITAKGSELGTVETLTGEAKLDLAELNLNAPRLVDNRAKIIRDLRASQRPSRSSRVS